LVVEDNTAMGLVLRLNLERAGYEVVVASSAEEAWQLLETQHFHLAVIDHYLPGMHGSELCARIRNRETLQDMPLMMLTAKKLELKVDQLLNELRVWKVIPKPFSPSALTRWIHECLREHESTSDDTMATATVP
jgi:two-component system alkaline phosphatase synthesis response regulator PhoP